MSPMNEAEYIRSLEHITTHMANVITEFALESSNEELLKQASWVTEIADVVKYKYHNQNKED